MKQNKRKEDDPYPMRFIISWTFLWVAVGISMTLQMIIFKWFLPAPKEAKYHFIYTGVPAGATFIIMYFWLADKIWGNS